MGPGEQELKTRYGNGEGLLVVTIHDFLNYISGGIALLQWDKFHPSPIRLYKVVSDHLMQFTVTSLDKKSGVMA